MKILKTLLSILVAALLFSSCKKDAENNSFVLEYRIIPDVGSAYEISYTDSTGTQIKTNQPSTFPNSAKKMTVTSRKFTAILTVNMGNPTYSPKPFILSILVDGVEKAKTEAVIPQQSLLTKTVQYAIE